MNPLITRASSSGHDMKGVYIVDEVETAVSPSLRRKEKTAMSKLMKEMAFFCSIFVVDFKKLSWEHEIGAGEDLSGNAELALHETPNNVAK